RFAGSGSSFSTECVGDQPPASHFFMNEFLAAPDSGLPSELTALVVQESAMHFFMNEVLAAPASGLPSLPIALLSQLSCAIAEPTAKVASNAATNTVRIMFLSFTPGWRYRPNPRS